MCPSLINAQSTKVVDYLLPRASSFPSNPGDAGKPPTAPGFIDSIEPWGCGEHSDLPALGFLTGTLAWPGFPLRSEPWGGQICERPLSGPFQDPTLVLLAVYLRIIYVLRFIILLSTGRSVTTGIRLPCKGGAKLVWRDLV